MVLFGPASHSVKAFMSNLRTLLCDSFLLLLGAGRICDGGSKLNTPGAGESMILVLESNLRNLSEMPVVLVSAANLAQL